MRISSTLSQVGGNFARPTKYNVILSLPAALHHRYGEKMDVLCKAVQAPGITVESQEIRVKGHPVSIPVRTLQNREVTLTFYLDEDYELRRIFQDWAYGLDHRSPVARNSDTASLVNSEDKFGSMILIGRDFNETLNKPIEWKFENVFPINVGEIDFNTETKDEISEVSVTLGYTRYLTNTPTSREVIEDMDNGINQMKG